MPSLILTRGLYPKRHLVLSIRNVPRHSTELDPSPRHTRLSSSKRSDPDPELKVLSKSWAASPCACTTSITYVQSERFLPFPTWNLYFPFAAVLTVGIPSHGHVENRGAVVDVESVVDLIMDDGSTRSLDECYDRLNLLCTFEEVASTEDIDIHEQV